MPEIKVCQVIDSINEETGGPAYAITNLSDSVSALGIESHIITHNYPHLGPQVTINGGSIVHSYVANKIVKKLNGFLPATKNSLSVLAMKPLDIIHNHGLWLFINMYARQVAVSNNIPLVISPHGTLLHEAMKYSKLKKKIAWLTFEKKNLSSANIFHATSENEVHSIRNFGFTQPIALIPDGVNLPDLNTIPSRTLVTNIFPELSNKKWVLYLGRLHSVKRIDRLLEAWHTVSILNPEWHLLVAGPSEGNCKKESLNTVETMNLGKSVTFSGAVSGDLKASMLGHADLFVLPSDSENFGISIAESLSYEVPVITTKGTPWQELHTHNCGWWVEKNVDSLSNALIEGMNTSDSDRKTMGINGRNLIKSKYSWDVVGRSMFHVYEWLANGGDTPDCLF
jgi:glycosyltransferase involved in cell wall biosynthesis